MRSYNCTTWAVDTLADVGVFIESHKKTGLIDSTIFPGGHPGAFGEAIRSGLAKAANFELMTGKQAAKYINENIGVF